jgi:tRNA threonylcarbamoyladenosine biosynthesis protein TsaB
MKILAVEFSSAQRSVAIIDSEMSHGAGDLLPGRVLGEARESGAQALQALSLVDQALQSAKLEREAVQAVAVGLGPGSYTGIRAGIALAQGWQLARQVQVRGVSSMECLAAGAFAEGWRGKAALVIDAQRHEFYYAVYEIADDGWKEISPLHLVGPQAVQEFAQGGAIVAGPEVDRWFPFGQVIYPRAGLLGRLATAHGVSGPGQVLEPIYLRETAFVKAPPPRELPPL